MYITTYPGCFKWKESFQAFSTLMMDFKADRKIRDNSGKTATSYLKNVITSSVELKKGIAKNYVIKNGIWNKPITKLKVVA